MEPTNTLASQLLQEDRFQPGHELGRVRQLPLHPGGARAPERVLALRGHGGAVGLQLVRGLVSALLLNRAFRGLNFVRSLFVLPCLLPAIVVALIFQWLLSQEYGVVNLVLMQTGVVARPINFFGGLGLVRMRSIRRVLGFIP